MRQGKSSSKARRAEVFASLKGLKQIPHLDASPLRQVFSDRVQRRSSIKTRGFDDQLRVRIKTTPGKQWAVGRALNGAVKRVFDARGIELPFPHQTIYFGADKNGEAPPAFVAMAAPKP